MKRVIVIMVVGAALAWAVVVRGNLDVLGTLTAKIVDFAASTATTPMQTGTSLPSTCSVGQAFFKTDATAGQNIYLCTATDTWTQLQGGAGGWSGTLDWKFDPQYVSVRTEFTDTTTSGIGSPTLTGDFRLERLNGSESLNPVDDTGYVPPSTRLGYVNVATAASSGSNVTWAARLHYTKFNSYDDSLYGRTDRNWEIGFAFRLPTSGDLSDVEMFAGLGAPAFTRLPGGVYLAYRPGTTGSNFYWYEVTDSNVWGNSYNTGVAADNNWHKVRIRSDGTSTYRMWLQLDGGPEVSVCQSGCNINKQQWPMDAARSIVFGISTSSAARKTVQLDYLYFWMDTGGRE